MVQMADSSCLVCFFKQETAYEMRISDWSSDVCSSDLPARHVVCRTGDSGGRRRDAEPRRGDRACRTGGAGQRGLGRSQAADRGSVRMSYLFRHAGLVPASKDQQAMTLLEGWTPERVRGDESRL